jgi:hypothetical protein
VNRIVLDQSAASQLPVCSSSQEQFEVLDPAGKTLGYFLPAIPPNHSDAEVYAWLKTQISDEELDRRSKEPLGRTTAEVLAHLKSL